MGVIADGDIIYVGTPEEIQEMRTRRKDYETRQEFLQQWRRGTLDDLEGIFGGEVWQLADFSRLHDPDLLKYDDNKIVLARGDSYELERAPEEDRHVVEYVLAMNKPEALVSMDRKRARLAEERDAVYEEPSAEELRELQLIGIDTQSLEPAPDPETLSATIPIPYDNQFGMKHSALIENDVRKLLPAHGYTGPQAEGEELVYTGGAFGDVSLRITARAVDVHFDGRTPSEPFLHQLERIVEHHAR